MCVCVCLQPSMSLIAGARLVCPDIQYLESSLIMPRDTHSKQPNHSGNTHSRLTTDIQNMNVFKCTHMYEPVYSTRVHMQNLDILPPMFHTHLTMHRFPLRHILFIYFMRKETHAAIKSHWPSAIFSKITGRFSLR